MTDTKNISAEKLDFSHPLKNLRHERFSQLYVTNPINIGAIYRESGYQSKDLEHGRQNAYKLLRMDTIRGRIDWLVAERNERLGLDGDDVIRGLYMMRDRCAGGQLVLDRQGKKVTEWVTVDGKEQLCVVWRNDVTGFLRASELLAKYHGLLVEKSESVVHNASDEKLEAKADDIIKNMNYSKTIKPSKNKASIDGDGSTIPIPVSKDNYVDDTKKSDYVVYDGDGKAVS